MPEFTLFHGQKHTSAKISLHCGMLGGQCASLGKSLYNIGSDGEDSYEDFVRNMPDADLRRFASCVSVDGRRMVMTDAVIDSVKWIILSDVHPDDPEDFRGAFLDAFQRILLTQAPHVIAEEKHTEPIPSSPSVSVHARRNTNRKVAPSTHNGDYQIRKTKQL